MTDFSHIEKQIDALEETVADLRALPRGHILYGRVIDEAEAAIKSMRQMLKAIRCISKHTMAIDFDSELEIALDKLGASDE